MPMIELANAIKEMGLVIVFAAALISVLWIVLKWLLNQTTEDRKNSFILTTKFTEVMSEFSKVNAATALVLSDMRATICADQTEARSHHQLASTSFAYIKQEHEGFDKRLEVITERIEEIEKIARSK